MEGQLHKKDRRWKKISGILKAFCTCGTPFCKFLSRPLQNNNAKQTNLIKVLATMNAVALRS